MIQKNPRNTVLTINQKMIENGKLKVLGYDVSVVNAVCANIISWFVRTFLPKYIPYLLPTIENEDANYSDGVDDARAATTSQPQENSCDDVVLSGCSIHEKTQCIVIGRPGGVEQLRCITLKPGIATCGYNVIQSQPDMPFTKNYYQMIHDGTFPSDCVLVHNHAFSINYADCCIRWGLYDSATQFCGYPICPGFDVAGSVLFVGSDVTQDFQIGDPVFGCTFFGAYSTFIIVPALQIRPIPKFSTQLTFVQAASIPTVALTSLYALYLAGHYSSSIAEDNNLQYSNRAILIHSAAGGVGSMLIQMSKRLGLSPIVGVVGRTNKVATAKALGCDYVIDKSSVDVWETARSISPNGFITIMDPNGIDTVQQSYQHLGAGGRLIIYGFHTNLPQGHDLISPWQWIKMGVKMNQMPKIDFMDMVNQNKSILAFNLSFFTNECGLLSQLFTQIITWIQEQKLELPTIVEMNMKSVDQAHNLIQSGTTVGKIVINTN
jgi:synaptic vesicle membrane protein VAT-1